MDGKKLERTQCPLVRTSSHILGCLLIITCLTCTIVYKGWRSTSNNVIVQYEFIHPITNDSGVDRIFISRDTNVENVNVSSGDKKHVTGKSGVTKTIISYTPSYWNMERWKNFSHCKVNQCKLAITTDINTVRHADVVMFQANKVSKFPKVNSTERSRQFWVLYSQESPGFSHNRWRKIVNNRFNVTLTYKPNGYLQAAYGSAHKLTTSPSSNDQSMHEKILLKVKQKKKGAFAYVTNCGSVGYKRIELMKELSKFVHVDIFGGCTGVSPCKRGDYRCEERLHTDYKFFLSFENSLCKDYITEKFWYRLNSSAILLPVAMGGLSIKDYTDVAPPDSFLHVYNFTSIKDLGLYMNKLMDDTNKYMNYHKWRNSYRIDTTVNLCGVCQLAHQGKHLNAVKDLASQWDFSSCKNYKH